MRRKSRPRIDDCLIILTYVSKHPDADQTYETLAEATDVPLWTVKNIFTEARNRNDSILSRTATKYRFDFEIYTGHNRNKQILWACYVGYNHPD